MAELSLTKLTYRTRKMKTTQRLSKKTAIERPLVVFVHGGGWRRGDREAWRHYISCYDFNILVFLFLRFYNLFENVGASLASRGIACALISYPLIKLSFPWLCLEMLTSYISSFLVSGCLCTVVLSLLTCEYIWGYIMWQEHLQSIRTFLEPSISLEYVLAAMTLHNALVLLFYSVWRKHFRLSWAETIASWGIFLLSIRCFVQQPQSSYRQLQLAVGGAFLTQFLFLLGYGRIPNITSHDQMNFINCAVERAIEFGAKTSSFDARGVHLIGHSAGGNLVARMALDTDFRRRIHSVVSISGVHDLQSLNIGPLKHFYLFPVFGKNQDVWNKASPSRLVQHAKHIPRILVISAEYDLQLRKDAEEFVQMAQTRSAQIKYLVIPRANHFSIMTHFQMSNRVFSLADICADFVKDCD